MTTQPFHARNGLTVNTNLFVVNATSGTVGVNTTSSPVSFGINATDGILLPVGNTGQRPSSANGVIRYSNDVVRIEVSTSGSWLTLVSNTDLVGNLALYQTSAGLSANVATLTANNVSFVGTTPAGNVVSNNQLSSNLASYLTIAGLASNVDQITVNSALYWDGATSASVLNVNNATYWGGLYGPTYINQPLITTSSPSFTSLSLNNEVFGSTTLFLKSENTTYPATFQLSGTGGGATISAFAAGYTFYNDTGATAWASLGSSSGWSAGSDIKFKENIETMPVLDRLANSDFRAVTFDWKEDSRHDFGVIAQELQEVFPEAVEVNKHYERRKTPVLDTQNNPVLDEDGNPRTQETRVATGETYLAINYGRLSALALMAVKELADRNAVLQKRLDDLENKFHI